MNWTAVCQILPAPILQFHPPVPSPHPITPFTASGIIINLSKQASRFRLKVDSINSKWYVFPPFYLLISSSFFGRSCNIHHYQSLCTFVTTVFAQWVRLCPLAANEYRLGVYSFVDRLDFISLVRTVLQSARSCLCQSLNCIHQSLHCTPQLLSPHWNDHQLVKTGLKIPSLFPTQVQDWA